MAASASKSNRLWVTGGVAASVLLMAASWLLLIGPERSSSADLRAQAADTNQQNLVLEANNRKLAGLNQRIDDLRAKLLRAVDSLPPTSGLPEFTREAAAIASGTGVHLTGMTIGAVNPAGATTAPASAPQDGSDTTTQAPTTATPTTAAVPAPGSGQFSIGITLSSSGSLRNQIAFLDALRKGARGVLINSSQVSAGEKSRRGSVDAANTMTTQLTVFSQPMSSEQLASLKKLLRPSS